eukprot:1438399-Rhodomonas_salina.2
MATEATARTTGTRSYAIAEPQVCLPVQRQRPAVISCFNLEIRKENNCSDWRWLLELLAVAFSSCSCWSARVTAESVLGSAGLGATAPDGDFDYEAIGGSPWAGSSSSSSDGEVADDCRCENSD